jgi:hypothetical protein
MAFISSKQPSQIAFRGLCKTPSKVIPYSDTGSPNLFSVIKRISEIFDYAKRRFCKALFYTGAIVIRKWAEIE